MKTLSSTQLGDLTLKNRIVMAPMCMYSADEQGFAKPFHSVHYATRGYGGVGLVIIEATAVEPRGRISKNDLGIWSDAHIDGLKGIVEAVHASGAKIAIQLAHAGRKCNVNTETTISASSFPFSEHYPKPLEMTKQDISDVVEAFKQAATRAEKAGFDAIEIHGAHGYLINQFLSPLSNRRNDEYGGSQENRQRFLREVTDAVKSATSKPLLLRLSAEEYEENGNHIEDTVSLVSLFRNDYVAFDISSGGVVNVSFAVYPGYQMGLSEKIKALGVKTIGGGLITTIEECESYIINHQADFIFLGRELLRNPYFVLEADKRLGVNKHMLKAYERGY